jgi:hypothetical protein
VLYQIYDELEERGEKREENGLLSYNQLSTGCNTDSTKFGKRIKDNTFN